MNDTFTTVGILGGGQLARMLALAGAPLGIRFRLLDNMAEACGGQVAPMQVGDYRDQDALTSFAAGVDVVTFDFENVPATSAEFLSERVPVFPNPRALALTQDRLAEKTLFQSLSIATPAFAAVNSWADLQQAITVIGMPGVLKTRRLGYDGKGQARIKSMQDAESAWQELGAHELIYEAFVAFEREVSVLAVRARDGEFRAWPLTQNWHRDGILAASLAPAPNANAIAPKALEMARKVAEQLDYVGVFALELFVKDGALLANEMAPRVHNSGHWTIEGAITSQFENHVRAVLGLPLGDTGMSTAEALMLNWIGELPDRNAVLGMRDAHWHDYGKTPRAGRKVGHATLIASDAQSMREQLRSLGATLRIEPITELVIETLESN